SDLVGEDAAPLAQPREREDDRFDLVRVGVNPRGALRRRVPTLLVGTAKAYEILREVPALDRVKRPACPRHAAAPFHTARPFSSVQRPRATSTWIPSVIRSSTFAPTRSMPKTRGVARSSSGIGMARREARHTEGPRRPPRELVEMDGRLLGCDLLDDRAERRPARGAVDLVGIRAHLGNARSEIRHDGAGDDGRFCRLFRSGCGFTWVRLHRDGT